MRFSYVLPDPGSYRDWKDFDADLACLRPAGYEAVELQIADPAQCPLERLQRALRAAGLPVCAIQTGATYASLGNCLCTAQTAIRRRTIALLRRFIDLGAACHALLVFGTLQGRLADEPDRAAGARRIAAALRQVGAYATARRTIIALEPVNHLEVGYHNTIAAAARLVRQLHLPGVRLMIDTFHMNIEEREPLPRLTAIRDILAHVHLSETNRDVLGRGHWPTPAFLDQLDQLGYGGYCSVGVYHTRVPRRECIRRCLAQIRPRPA